MKFFSFERSALNDDWSAHLKGTWNWLNPPYSRGNLGPFTQKAREQAQRGVGCVMLVPATPGAGWFLKNLLRGCDATGSEYLRSQHDPALEGYELIFVGTGYKLLIRFLATRPSFLRNGKPTEHSSLRDSALVTWWPRCLW